jgi:Tol biopolymer transport system component
VIVSAVMMEPVSSGTFPGTNGKIAFSSNISGSYDIWVMDADGSNQTNITNTSAADRLPAWSPDGTKIVFASIRSGSWRVWVMDADGSNPTMLSIDGPSSWTSSHPSWSPDGTKIVYKSDVYSGSIFVMDADGSNKTAVRMINNSKDYHPQWSPDGTKIVFQHSSQDFEQIWVMDADGSNPTNLTGDFEDRDNEDPIWSPDGTKILFNRGGQSGHIWVMDADGSNKTNLTTFGWGLFEVSKAQFPSWSPDGTKIVFHGYSGDFDLYVMDADGSNPTNITNYETGGQTVRPIEPDWGPGAAPTPTPTPTVTPVPPTATPVPPPTATPVPPPTATPVPPTATPVPPPPPTPVPPTPTPVPPTATAVPPTPTPTPTPVPPTATAVPPTPTPTPTPVPPTATPVPPTATAVPPTPTPTPTPVPPTATPVPPTATPVPPTATSVPPTATPVSVPVVAKVIPPNTPVPLKVISAPAVPLLASKKALTPRDYGINMKVRPMMMNAAVVGIRKSPSGMTGAVVAVLWTRPIDGETFDISSLTVGGQQPSEVWVDEQDLFVTHMIFDTPIDMVGGAVQIADRVFDIWGEGIYSGHQTINAGFVGGKTHLLPFAGLSVLATTPSEVPKGRRLIGLIGIVLAPLLFVAHLYATRRRKRIDWKPPSSALIPPTLTKCGEEQLVTDGVEEIVVDKYCITFNLYQGEEQIYNYGNKEIISVEDKPTYAELAALSLFRREGWNGMWLDGYRRKKWSGLSEEAKYPDSIDVLLDSLSSITERDDGIFDLILWRGEAILFIELKRSKRDRINQNQIDWVRAALSSGFDLSCFAVLEWQLSDD